MPASVTFKCIKGPLNGKIYSFQERASFLIGRSEDCVIRIPRTPDTMEVSRHHCLVELTPPLARIRDFGSLNGTYLNDERIGSRDPSKKPGEDDNVFPQRDLSDGDIIRLANVVIAVSINMPITCSACGAEIPEADAGEAAGVPAPAVCHACRIKKEQVRKRQEEEDQRRQEQVRLQQAREQEKPQVAAIPKAEQDRLLENARKMTEEERKKAAVAGRAAPSPPMGQGQMNALELIKAILEKARQGAPEIQNIKGYSIISTLGRGGMGAVYLARKEATGQEVALKVMLPQMAVNRDAVARFRREMDNATVLRHPNIVQAFESGYADNAFYLTMEVCSAGSVQDLIQKAGGRLPYDQAVDLMLQALEGLEYLHKAPLPNVKLANGKYGKGTGLVHRDLKPANLFLTETNGKLTVKIADLGLAKAFDQAGLSGLTMTGQVAGSPPFMSRQQVIDYLHAKPEVDVWAIAATFYYLLTGAYPRDFLPGKDVWLTILQTDPVPIRNRDSSIPAKLARTIDFALIDKPRISISDIAVFRREILQAV